jgi:hypothetical protein
MTDGAPTGAEERNQRRRMAIAVGVAGLLVGLLIGSAGASHTKTVTHAREVVRTETTTVPVIHTRTVTKVRRVVRVRTRTVTVQAQPVDQGAPAPAAGSPPSSYAGKTCAEIGHSFHVTPGSDPEHDADNDGIACEAYG